MMAIVDLAALTKFIGTAGTGAAVPIAAMYVLFTPKDEYYQHVADSKVGLVIQLANEAANERNGDYKDALCRQIEEAIGEICAAQPTHSMCQDRQIYREKAGCN
jgi:hypothetical protein